MSRAAVAAVQYRSCALNVLMEYNCRAVGQTQERLRVQRDTDGLVWIYTSLGCFVQV
jgi:hypothetical protein